MAIFHRILIPLSSQITYFYFKWYLWLPIWFDFFFTFNICDLCVLFTVVHLFGGIFAAKKWKRENIKHFVSINRMDLNLFDVNPFIFLHWWRTLINAAMTFLMRKVLVGNCLRFPFKRMSKNFTPFSHFHTTIVDFHISHYRASNKKVTYNIYSQKTEIMSDVHPPNCLTVASNIGLSCPIFIYFMK